MDGPESIGDQDGRAARPVFVSYASADRKRALAVCEAIERRGPACWISTRDVALGENYQEAIVRAIRGARAMVLVFSEAANHSDEIKKELSLASRHRVPVLALRIADVEPSDAFAYELSTRQWIDGFADWDGSIDALAGRIGQLSGEGAVPIPSGAPARQRGASGRQRPSVMIAAIAVLLVVVAGAWWWLRPPAAAAHSMVVRLAGFQRLSGDLPATIGDSVNAELAAAFNAAGVVGVSTAAAPAPGTAPAYALGGTLQREGQTIRVITRLTNERSGATLWSHSFNYANSEAGRVPRHIAVNAGNVVRCGLFGASTYRKPLPDAVLGDYLQFCEGHWDPELAEGRKALVAAQRVVAAVPDFSWGWAGVAGGYWKVALSADDARLAADASASGRAAADRAVAIDPQNSEALYIKAVLTDRDDWIGRDRLFQRAIAARRLDCGCEYHQYGWMLLDVGRVAEALDRLRKANDMLALYVYTPLTLAEGLVVAGKEEEAKTYFDAAIDLAPNAGYANSLAALKATATGDARALADSKLEIAANLRAALEQGYAAAASENAGAKAAAVKTLLALPLDQQREPVARLLARLGAAHEAFAIAARRAEQYHGPALFFYRDMRATLNDPGFPAEAEKLGLMNYWKTTRTRPDVCNEAGPPPFCRSI